MSTKHTPEPDYAANVALFLVEKTGTCLGRWIGRMSATEQRALFGRYIGKGRIVINGAAETISSDSQMLYRPWARRHNKATERAS